MGGRGQGTGEERDLNRKAHTNGTTAQNHNGTESLRTQHDVHRKTESSVVAT